MIKGKKVRIYYPVIQASTGQRVSQDAANHTIYVTVDDKLELLNVVPVELTYGESPNIVYTGEYTFELPASYTNSDTVSIIILSSNSTVDAIIPPLELKFDEPKATLTPQSIQNVTDSILGSTVTPAADEASVITVSNILSDLQGTNTKVKTYPIYSNFVVAGLDEDDIAEAVLTKAVTNTMCTSTYSLAGSIMAGFYANMDADNRTWTIYKPNGETFFQREFEMDTDLKPVSDIAPRS